MSCLTDYIGIKFTDAPVPKSGLYINQLPAISTELIDKVADCEQGDYLGMWSDVQVRAYELFKTDIISYMSEYARLEQEVYQTKKFTVYGRTAETLSASSEWRGCYVRLPESKYSQLYIKNIFVYSQSEVTTVMRVYDAQDGMMIYEQEIDLVEGFNTIEVEQTVELKFRVTELLIVVDCTSVDTIKTDNEYFHFWGDDGCCTYSRFRNVSYPEIVSAVLPYGSNPVNGNITRNGTGKGIWIDASIICSIDQFICQNKKILKTAWWYLLGREILTEKLGGNNINWFASGNLERTAWLRDGSDNNGSFHRTYKAALKNSIEGISIKGDQICFDCFNTTQVKTATIIP